MSVSVGISKHLSVFLSIAKYCHGWPCKQKWLAIPNSTSPLRLCILCVYWIWCTRTMFIIFTNSRSFCKFVLSLLTEWARGTGARERRPAHTNERPTRLSSPNSKAPSILTTMSAPRGVFNSILSSHYVSFAVDFLRSPFRLTLPFCELCEWLGILLNQVNSRDTSVTSLSRHKPASLPLKYSSGRLLHFGLQEYYTAILPQRKLTNFTRISNRDSQTLWYEYVRVCCRSRNAYSSWLETYNWCW